MSHEHATVEQKPILESSTALTFALIIVGLLIATVNFTRAMSGGHDDAAAHHEKSEHVEAVHTAH